MAEIDINELRKQRHLFSFENETEHSTHSGKTKPLSVVYVKGDDKVYYNCSWPEHDYSQDYLTFVNVNTKSMNFSLRLAEHMIFSTLNYISYSVDDGQSWVTTYIPQSPNGQIVITTPTINPGGSVLWKGEGKSLSYPTSRTTFESSRFDGTTFFDVCGNIGSLIYGDDFANPVNQTSLNSYTFWKLFNSSYIVSAEHLIMPFMENRCYQEMFSNSPNFCHSPKLTAETLSSYCYYNMFSGCTALNHVEAMFIDCSTPSSYLGNWLSGVSTTGTFVKNPNATWDRDAIGIPQGWSVQTASQ